MRNPLPPVQDVWARLREAFARLPIIPIVIGSDLPIKVVDACAGEGEQAGAQWYRWRPLLIDNVRFKARSEGMR